MFNNSNMSTTNYSSTLIGWAALPTLVNNTLLDAGTITYNLAANSSRQSLIDNYNWTINDGGLV